ncbi:hypothetical protein FJT64_006639 [Amphibalanus amphitrite]|uniref:Uncharacterized protein n=1 Tax=Amphibalanus amphitrite TaxID=1232801 RepID=A0A6A4W1J3_AMPAM|nr:hypothetical protein FJT64_006639 [Amphibalanus amphitrite]
MNSERKEMAFREMAELEAMVAQFKVEALKSVSPTEMIGFGMKDSHVYRQMFMESTKGLSAEVRTWIVILATAVKNRERIIMELNTKFTDKEWRMPVLNFYMNKTGTKNSDNLGPVKLLPVVNIPGCVPPITALAWKSIKAESERTYENFVNNQWVAQLYVDADVLEDQKAYEQHFWEHQVTKGGKNYGPGFQMRYWDTKSKDNYPLLNWDMTRYLPNNDGPYTKAQITTWLSLSGEADAAGGRP